MSALIELLMTATGLNEHDIWSIVRTAPQRYKTYSIPKRNGSSRLISQPARELKVLQRALVVELLSRLPVHPAATAYRDGISIKDNAAAHAGHGPILKFDFKDFFPSIKSTDWSYYCDKYGVFQEKIDIHISSNILFHRARGSIVHRLAIGAPSSPCLSNILMRDIDQAIADAVAPDGVLYTRYADDLTFSAKRTGNLLYVEGFLRTLLKQTASPRLSINIDKTVRATRKYRRMVTGLILTNDGTVSVGHDRKRLLRSSLHHAKRGLLSNDEMRNLSGTLAFIKNIEPNYYLGIVEKYGASLIADIKGRKKRPL